MGVGTSFCVHLGGKCLIQNRAMSGRVGVIFDPLRWNVSVFQCVSFEFVLWVSGFRFAQGCEI